MTVSKFFKSNFWGTKRIIFPLLESVTQPSISYIELRFASENTELLFIFGGVRKRLSRLKVARGLRLLGLARPSKTIFLLHYLNYYKISKNSNL